MAGPSSRALRIAGASSYAKRARYRVDRRCMLRIPKLEPVTADEIPDSLLTA